MELVLGSIVVVSSFGAAHIFTEARTFHMSSWSALIENLRLEGVQRQNFIHHVGGRISLDVRNQCDQKKDGFAKDLHLMFIKLILKNL